MKAFISHPCSGNVWKNREANRALVERLHKKYPDVLFVSPLFTFDYLDDDGDWRDDIMEVCFAMIDCCDELWSFGNSEGCRDEKEYAESIGLPIKTKGEVL